MAPEISTLAKKPVNCSHDNKLLVSRRIAHTHTIHESIAQFIVNAYHVRLLHEVMEYYSGCSASDSAHMEYLASVLFVLLLLLLI